MANGMHEIKVLHRTRCIADNTPLELGKPTKHIIDRNNYPEGSVYIELGDNDLNGLYTSVILTPDQQEALCEALLANIGMNIE